MSKEVLVIGFGIMTALLPFMGLPGSWRTLLLVIVGVVITIIGFFLRSEALGRGGGEGTHFFIDNRKSSTPPHQAHETQNNSVRIQ